MSFAHINLRLSNCDWNDAVSKTVDVLLDDGIAVVPTETVYGLAARLADGHAVKKLIKLKGRSDQHPFALAFPNSYTIEDMCGELSPLAQRLVRRCLPGPVSLVLDVLPNEQETVSPDGIREQNIRENLFWKLPAEIRHVVSKTVSQQSSICCRIPDHPLLLPVLGELNEPIVLTSANKSGHGESTSVGQIIASLGSGIDLVVDDGTLTAPTPSTIVRIVDNNYTILREGALKSETIKRLAALMILFVCTDNTCRSPMAEGFCEKMLSERRNSSEHFDHVQDIVVLSSGLSATEGKPATAKAVEVLQAYGIDLSEHRALPINETYVRFADYIFTMTRHQRESLLSSWCNVDSRLSVLRPDGGDIIDPMGGSLDVYQHCAEQIQTAIAQRLTEIG